MSSKNSKSCLVVSYGPVPTPQYQTVEGGGMRAWGLACGLRGNGIDVTVGINDSFPQELSEHDGIRIINWRLDDRFTELINTYDSIVVSYCMGDPSVYIVNHLNDDVQLILDAYVPIYIEISARESKDIDAEYTAYSADLERFNKVLKRGDYFLCANEAQKTFYVGILSALGIINPRSYREERVFIVPFGIHDTPALASYDPYKKLGIKDKDFKVLWFGGLYPWFRIEELLGAILELSKRKDIKFIFVGGKNPFNPSPDFFKQYEKAVSFAKEHRLTNNTVYFVDWVDFDDRVNWYKNTDLVISLNNPGDENQFSWRTRVMDYVWGELAMLTNGGDPLSEDLVAAKAAVRLSELSAAAIVQSIEILHKDRPELARIISTVKGLKPNYYWHTITAPIKSIIGDGHLPYREERVYRNSLGIRTNELSDSPTVNLSQSKIRKTIDMAPRIVSKIRRKGVRNSARFAFGIARTQVKKYGPKKYEKKYIFISHPIDHTGAPIVLIQIIEEFAKKYGGKNIQLITPNIWGDPLKKVRELGVKVDKAVFGIGFRAIRMQLGIRKNDFVLINTAAIYDNYRDFIFLWLKTGRLKHAYWFIHEDIAQLPIIHKEFLDDANIKQMHRLLQEKRLSILTPSERTKKEYAELLKATGVSPIKLHVEVDSKYVKTRKQNNFDTINFLLSGTPSDGRKGQFLALSAFYYFIKNYYEKDPDQYRDFKLHLVAIGKDYISQQIEWVGSSLLANRVVFYPSMPKEKALAITAKCNAVICCSLNETFGLYVAEAMVMGHVVLRNNCAGVDEQLENGVNGYLVDHTDIKQFAGVIEKVLNKSTSNTRLQTMGKASQEIITEYTKNSYVSQIEKSGNGD